MSIFKSPDGPLALLDENVFELFVSRRFVSTSQYFLVDILADDSNLIRHFSDTIVPVYPGPAANPLCGTTLPVTRCRPSFWVILSQICFRHLNVSVRPLSGLSHGF